MKFTSFLLFKTINIEAAILIDCKMDKIKKYSGEWWDEFLDRTDHLKKTCVFKDCMTRDETRAFRTNVLEIVRTLAFLRTDKYGYRVYVDGKLLDRDGMSQIYDSPPLPGEDIYKWTERVFKDKKFGMIINLGEKFNLELSQQIAIKTKPYLEKTGFPVDGINFSIFIGNYDKTPLGIHKDPPGQDVMHFHLGPGEKHMYTWGKDQFEDLINNKGYDKKDVEGLLPFSTRFSFNEGDMYFMPEGEYHIGKQDGLSMAITFWRYNHTKGTLVRKLQNVIFSQYLKTNEDLLKPDKNPLTVNDWIDTTLDTIEIPAGLENKSYKELMREAYSDLRYSIHSNAGYRTSPFSKDGDMQFDLDDFIEIEKPFNILYKTSFDNQKLHVYVRGQKVELNNFECIRLFIQEINKGIPIKVRDVIRYLDAEWNENIGIYILNLLYKNHGIKKLLNRKDKTAEYQVAENG